MKQDGKERTTFFPSTPRKKGDDGPAHSRHKDPAELPQGGQGLRKQPPWLHLMSKAQISLTCTGTSCNAVGAAVKGGGFHACPGLRSHKGGAKQALRGPSQLLSQRGCLESGPRLQKAPLALWQLMLLTWYKSPSSQRLLS